LEKRNEATCWYFYFYFLINVEIIKQVKKIMLLNIC
jgi:hypothetical protein